MCVTGSPWSSLCVFFNVAFQSIDLPHVGAGTVWQKGCGDGCFDTLTLMRENWKRQGRTERSLWAFPRFVSDSFINATLDSAVSPAHTHWYSKWSFSVSLYETYSIFSVCHWQTVALYPPAKFIITNVSSSHLLSLVLLLPTWSLRGSTGRS